jgi:hypothetical protein
MDRWEEIMSEKSLKALAIVLFASGLWDTFGGIIYAFMVGTGRSIDNPPVHPFYAIFTASFFFSFAYLELLAAFNVRRYLLIIGGVIIGRVFYVVLLYYYIYFVADFPRTFWFTGIIDSFWTICYIVLTLVSSEIRLKDLFIPYRRES